MYNHEKDRPHQSTNKQLVLILKDKGFKHKVSAPTAEVEPLDEDQQTFFTYELTFKQETTKQVKEIEYEIKEPCTINLCAIAALGQYELPPVLAETQKGS